jgi:hypothetical protein
VSAPSDNYLFRDDSRPRIARWAKSLRYFRFVRSGGGMSGGGDHLLLALRVRTQKDLEKVFTALGVPLRPSLPDPAELGGHGSIRFTAGPQDDPGLSPALGQVRVGAATVHAYYLYGRLELSISDDTDTWRVTDRAVDAARDIEPRVEQLAGLVIDPPQDDPLCVSPRHHPEIWESPAERASRIARLRSRSRRLKVLWRLLALAALAAVAVRCMGGTS